MRLSALVILPVMLVSSVAADAETPYDALTDRELATLGSEATRWIRELEERERPLARPLTAGEKDALAGYFTPGLLERARLRPVDGIDNPEFYSAFFAERGQPLPIDFRQASGLALVDTVLLVRSRVAPGSPGWLPLLFHELVHLAQVEVLGREDHVAAYVRSWAGHGFRYRTIPQEEQAYALAARFRAAPDRPFSVAAEVGRRFAGEVVDRGSRTVSGRRP